MIIDSHLEFRKITRQNEYFREADQVVARAKSLHP
jgi:hypothetical protein